MSGKISAIIPIYNTPDEYLHDMIWTLLHQTYENFEVILVDDGSQQLTADLCDKFGQLDPRVKVIHQQNQGPSVARNTGMKAATGEFITFVDSDDRLLLHAWEICIQKMEIYNADCLVFGWIDHSEGTEKRIPTAVEKDQLLSTEYVVEKIASNNTDCGGGYPWNKIWRRNSILAAHNNEIPLFDTALFAYEDKEWIIRTLIGMNSVVLSTDILYDYRYVPTSLTNNLSSWEKRQFNAYFAYDKILSILKPVSISAFIGAVNFYFYFGFTDLFTQLRHPSWFGGMRRIRKTKKHMYALCRKIKISELKGYKKKLTWLIMQIWGRI